MDDPHDLRRFVAAQEGVYERARDELRAGRKTTHWIWFVFPQLKGLGRSAMAERFGIASAAEARAYLAHPVLGARLVESTRIMLGIQGKSALEILGSPDDLKFRSSMTLFEIAGPAERSFGEAIEKFFHGGRDERTLELLR